MGYYIKVESDVNIYVEDVNPEGNKTILWITVGLPTIRCLNISLISNIIKIQDDIKLIPTVPGYKILLSQTRPNYFNGISKCFVSDIMPQGIIYLLETIQIGQYNRKRRRYELLCLSSNREHK